MAFEKYDFAQNPEVYAQMTGANITVNKKKSIKRADIIKTIICTVLIFMLGIGIGIGAGKLLLNDGGIDGYKMRIYDGKVELYNDTTVKVLGNVHPLLEQDPFNTSATTGIPSTTVLASVQRAQGVTAVQEMPSPDAGVYNYYDYSSDGATSNDGGGSGGGDSGGETIGGGDSGLGGGSGGGDSGGGDSGSGGSDGFGSDVGM